MFGTVLPLADIERALEEAARGHIVPGVLEQQREVVERVREVRMVGAKCLLPDREGALVERARSRVVAHVA